MQRRVVISKGKRFLVNAAGWEDGIGPGASVGTLWMSEGSASWYSVFVTGSKNTAVVGVNQTKLPSYTDNSIGYQLLACDDGRSYFVYLSGTSPVTLNVSQSAYTGSATAKPNFLIQSSTDSNFYKVYLHNAAGTIQIAVDPNYVSASWVYQSGIY